MKGSLILNRLTAAGSNYGNHGDSRWSRFSRGNNQNFPTAKRFKKKAYEEWQKDYRQHSIEIGKTISDVWIAPNRLASCQYQNGRFEYNQAVEPGGKDVGLARLHLVNGYPTVWNLYQKAKAESTDVCNEIRKLISRFEEIIISTIDTKSGAYNLQRRTVGYSPQKCSDIYYYIDKHIFEAVFELVQDRLDGKSLRSLNLVHGIHTIDEISYPYTSLQLVNGLGSGSEDEIIELKSRIENLINDPDTQCVVEHYNELKVELQNSELKKSYREAIKNIWAGIRDDGDLLKAEGVCKNITECRPRA